MPAPLSPSVPPMLAMTRPSSTSGEPAAPKKPLRHVEPARRVHVPDALAGREIDRVQLSFGAEGVDAAAGDHRHRSRSFVEAEVVAIASWDTRSATAARRCGPRTPRRLPRARRDGTGSADRRPRPDRQIPGRSVSPRLSSVRPRAISPPAAARCRRRCAAVRDTAASRRPPTRRPPSADRRAEYPSACACSETISRGWRLACAPRPTRSSLARGSTR